MFMFYYLETYSGSALTFEKKSGGHMWRFAYIPWLSNAIGKGEAWSWILAAAYAKLKLIGNKIKDSFATHLAALQLMHS